MESVPSNSHGTFSGTVEGQHRFLYDKKLEIVVPNRGLRQVRLVIRTRAVAHSFTCLGQVQPKLLLYACGQVINPDNVAGLELENSR